MRSSLRIARAISAVLPIIQFPSAVFCQKRPQKTAVSNSMSEMAEILAAP
jgi:hypothetical protein